MMPAGPNSDAVRFADLALRPELLQTLLTLGYDEPTPIQREAIPPLLRGHDVLGQAATGTGKTAAFALPVLQQLAEQRLPAAAGEPAGTGAGPTALILVPTRELAEQVSQAFRRYGQELGVRVLPVYGGQPIGRQLHGLDRGVDVVVATPGRALDHLARGTLRLGDVRTVVLDEADEMLDMGFAEEIEAILDQTPPRRQTVLFSATMPPRINAIAQRHLRDPVPIEMGQQPATGAATLVQQVAYVVSPAHKPAALARVLDVATPAAAIVFCRTREEVDTVTETLNARGFRAEALHGGMGQQQRDRVMGRLRSGAADLLVATDVAARGLDIAQLSHVVNYHVPATPEAYVHRIGRVGRAGREGVALTLAEPRERRRLEAIQRLTKQRINIEKVPSTADLRARRLELTRAALHERLLADDLEHFRAVVEALADEHDIMDVTLAAVKLAHESSQRGTDEAEIPAVAEPAGGTKPRRGPAGGGHRKGRPVNGAATGGTKGKGSNGKGGHPTALAGKGSEGKGGKGRREGLRRDRDQDWGRERDRAGGRRGR